MRAISIAVFIFILSLSMSAVKEAYGLPHKGPLWNSSVSEIKEYARVEQDTSFFGINMFRAVVNAIKVLVRVVTGAALLGSTLQAFIPYQLPSTLVIGLNSLGVTSALLGIVQFVRGVSTRGME